MIDTIQYGKNDSLRDEIKAYWSGRAATFDLSPDMRFFPKMSAKPGMPCF